MGGVVDLFAGIICWNGERLFISAILGRIGMR